MARVVRSMKDGVDTAIESVGSVRVMVGSKPQSAARDEVETSLRTAADALSEAREKVAKFEGA